MELVFFQMAFNDDVFKYFVLSCNLVAISVWILTLITGNYSQMDRLWPILPMVYAWSFLYTAIMYNPERVGSNSTTSIIKSTESSINRLIIMTTLITAWGVRLAYAFWRRGYYKKGHEDHRWPVVQKRFTSKISLRVFNLVFMGFLQNWILFGYALPIWFIQTNNPPEQEPLNAIDFALVVLYLLFYMIEAIADEQQWYFQSNKHKWLNNKSLEYSQQEIEDFKRGFYVRGLFKYSRHPNYFGDILLWWTIYAFTLSSQYEHLKASFHFTSLINYSMFSALLMTYLFQRSVRVTEKISSEKYKEYEYYKTKVGCIMPRSLFRPYEPLPVKEN